MSIIGTEKGQGLVLATEVQCNGTATLAWRGPASNDSADMVLGRRTMGEKTVGFGGV